MRHVAVLILILLALAAPHALAATLWVEKWGSTSLDCGSRSDPCLHIWLALAKAGTNDRIIVGPGSYRENLGFTIQGVRLESLAGPRGTLIEANDDTLAVVNISASRVRLGRKGRGFTLRGADASTSVSGVQVFSSTLEAIRVEGNIARDNGSGFILYGSRHVLRHNKAINNNAHGFYLRQGAKLMVRDNVAQSNGHRGFEFLDVGDSLVRNNLADDNEDRGFHFSTGSRNNRLLDNVADHNRNIGFSLSSATGSAVIGNIAARNTGTHFTFAQSTAPPAGTKPLQLKNNLSHSALSTSRGFEIGQVQDARIDGNTAVDSTGATGDGFLLWFGATAASFKGNNSFNNSSGCGIQVASGPELTYQKHFFGRATGADPDGPDVDNHDAACNLVDTVGSKHASKPSGFRARAAAKL